MAEVRVRAMRPPASRGNWGMQKSSRGTCAPFACCGSVDGWAMAD